MATILPPSNPEPLTGAAPGLLRDRNFLCLWWTGVASFLIRWLEVLVFGVFTYQTTESAFIVAMMTMLRLLPMALFGALLGTLAGRIERHKALVVVIGVSLLTSLVLTLMSYANLLEVWHLAVASFINGTAWASDNPIRRSMLGDVAGEDRMGRAMSLEVGSSNATRLVGPGVGGFLLATVGIAGIFAITTLIYLTALLTTLAVRHRDSARPGNGLSFMRTMRDGFLALKKDKRLVGAMWITVLFNLFGWPLLSMVPVIGKDELGLDATMVGLLASADGFGALISALIIAALSGPGRYGRIYIIGFVLFLAMLPLFAIAPNSGLAAMALALCGAGQAGFAIMQATLMFVVAPMALRSQAMGLMTMCIGTGPIGFLMLGALADQFGAPATTVFLCCTGLLLTALSWPWWRQLWRV